MYIFSTIHCQSKKRGRKIHQFCVASLALLGSNTCRFLTSAWSTESLLLFLQFGCQSLLSPLNLGLLEYSVMLRHLLLFLQSLLLLLLLHDVINQHSFVLEPVSLDHHVQLVVLVLVDLARFSVLCNQFAQHSHSLDPQNLFRHSRIGGTFPLTRPRVSALSSGQHSLSHSPSGVYNAWLSDDKTIPDQFPHSVS